MCTSSWFFHPNGYSLFFNRDEKRTRAIAQPPKVIRTDNGMAIMPTDPDGGGTWLGVNSSGWTYALLNYYQGQIPSAALTSRGTIVKQALNCETSDQVAYLFNKLPMSRFAPFSFLCVAPTHVAAQHKPAEQQEHSDTILLWRWTGTMLYRLPVKGILTSSSLHFEQANATRMQNAAQMNILNTDQVKSATPFDSGNLNSPALDNGVDNRALRHHAFHSSHGPQCGATSVCMHREDASTVSLSEITCSQGHVQFRYYDGSPCEVDAPMVQELELNPSHSVNQVA